MTGLSVSTAVRAAGRYEFDRPFSDIGTHRFGAVKRSFTGSLPAVDKG